VVLRSGRSSSSVARKGRRKVRSSWEGVREKKKGNIFAAEDGRGGKKRELDASTGWSRWRCGLGTGGGGNFWVASCWLLYSTR
jgi:hypothetical protein